MRPYLAAAYLLPIILLLFAAAVYFAWPSKPQTFDHWFQEHRKTCSQCSESNPDVPLCEEAFYQLQLQLSRDWLEQTLAD